MPAKVIDVSAERLVGEGYIQRADKAVNTLRDFRKADLAAYNAMFLVPPCPPAWKSRLTSQGFKEALSRAKRYDPKELKAAVERICDFDTFEFEPCLCYPWDGGLDFEDFPFWETAMCMVPKALRAEAGRKYWLFPLFN